MTSLEERHLFLERQVEQLDQVVQALGRELTDLRRQLDAANAVA